MQVIDRAALILDIFAKTGEDARGSIAGRACPASVPSTAPFRAVGNPDRMGGGIGTRGPGETKPGSRPADAATPHPYHQGTPRTGQPATLSLS